jgi:tight adherence protein C
MLLLLLALGCLAGAAYFLGELATQPARERATSVRRAATYGRFRVSKGRLERESLRDRALVPLSQSLAGLVLKLNPKTSSEAVALKLLAAGLGQKISPTGFLAAKGILSLAAAGFALLLIGSAGSAGLLFGLFLVLVGFFGPDYLVSIYARRRRDQIRAALPDALDLLAVSVEAGLGFDGAIAKLTEHMTGPLADEFGLTLSEMRIGESRGEALKRLGERADTPEVSSFTRSIIQADQLGTSLGRILRVQAADTRLRRQAAAEERAMKAPIKMLFPTVLFIFPAMFLVILGPAILNIDELF